MNPIEQLNFLEALPENAWQRMTQEVWPAPDSETVPAPQISRMIAEKTRVQPIIEARRIGKKIQSGRLVRHSGDPAC